MNRLLVKIRHESEHQDEAVLLEVPGERPITSFLPDLMLVLDSPQEVRELPFHWLELETGEVLSHGETLTAYGVGNSDVLILHGGETLPSTHTPSIYEPAPSVVPDEFDVVPIHEAEPTFTQPSPEIGHDAHAEEVVAEPIYSGPRLVSSTGASFHLRRSHSSHGSVIGRPNPEDGWPVDALDVDLTGLDVEHVSSRPHAQIFFHRGSYYVRDLRSTNGTIVNQRILPASGRLQINDGDAIRFGEGGVELTFRE